jgi:iron-sulfur cluster assembly accessory protein
MARLNIVSNDAEWAPKPELEPGTGFKLTEAGAEGVRKFLREKGAPEGSSLRVGVRGGGCSGFSYVVEVATDEKPSDIVVEAFGARVLVDPRSMKVLDGTTLDFKTGLMDAGFKFINPRATRTCGCGESFSLGG